MPTWEYKFFTSTDVPPEGLFTPAGRIALEQALNELGAQGWELVSADFADDQMHSFRFAAVLKRPRGQ